MKLQLILLGIGGASAFQTSRTVSPLSHVRSSPVSSTVCLMSTMQGCVEITEYAQRDIGSFDAWASNYGVQKSEGFALTSEDGVDWYAATSVGASAGSPVLSVPASIILSARTVRSEFGQSLQQAEQKLRTLEPDDQIDVFYLFVKILMEYEAGQNSPYFAWLNALPKTFYNGASMTEDCFSCLLPYVAQLAMVDRAQLTNFQNALKLVGVSDQVKNDADLHKWAYSIVQTRATDSTDGDKKIVPMADMFNHGAEDTEVELQYDQEGNCIAYATRDIPPGNQLRMSYGDPANPSPLFAKYGFLDKHSPATFCKILHIEPNEELVNLGLDFSRMLFYKETGEVSPEVWDVLLYRALGADRGLQEGFYRAHMNGDEATKQQYHQQYYQYTSTALGEHIDMTLIELDRLSNLAYSKDPVTHPRVPTILDHNEFVKRTFLKVKVTLGL